MIKEDAPAEFIIEAYKTRSLQNVCNYITFKGFKKVSVDDVRNTLKESGVKVRKPGEWSENSNPGAAFKRRTGI